MMRIKLSIRRALILLGIVFLWILLLYSTRFTFIPSSTWQSAGTAIALLLSVALNGAVLSYFRPWDVEKSRRASLSTIFAGYGFLQIVLFVMLWLPIIYAPGFVTGAVGSEHVLSTRIEKERGYGRFVCRYRVTSVELRDSFLRYLCVSEMEYAALPLVGDARLEGVRTVFGFYVQRIRWDEAASIGSLQ